MYSYDEENEVMDTEIGTPSDTPEDGDEDEGLEIPSAIFFKKDFEKTILSLFWKNGKLGAAVFHDESVEIHLLSDTADARPRFQLCHQLLYEIKPTTVITSKKLASTFLEYVERIVNEINEDEEESPCTNPEERHVIKLELLSSRYFEYERCKSLIMRMNILDKMKNLLEENRSYFLQSLINFNCKITVSAMGALLHFLDTFVSKIMLQLPSQHILGIKSLNLESLVFMDHESYRALEIFTSSKDRFTDGPFKTWSRDTESKRNSCLYNIFNHCSSVMGSQYLRTWLTHPIRDVERLKRRHEVIDFFLSCRNEVLVKNLRNALKNIHHLNKIVLRIAGTQATCRQWKTFHKTIHNALIIGQVCHNYKEKCSLFREISECLVDSLYIIVNVIETVIDFEATATLNRFTVKEGPFPELDEIKTRWKELPNVMEIIAGMELGDLPEIIESCSIVFMAEVGYLLAVPMWKEGLTEEELTLPDMHFKFLVDNIAHYKTARCVEMDNELGDIPLVILKHETEIQYEIINYIQKNFDSLSTLLEKLTVLDCLLAFTYVAGQYAMTKPNLLADEHFIDIKNGRHILTQDQVEVFISNDFTSSPVDSLVKIFTGPNSCGKSVYLKQVALIVYLAHIGSFVPAESTTMGVVDSIHTRIQTIESITKELSAFTLDLRQMYSSIYNSSKNSLIVIDEFGKGTADIDGIALLYACLDHFLKREIHCPHILVATHFHIVPSLLAQSSLVKSQTFEFVIENENIGYLFKVKDGFSGSSFACLAALDVGFPKKTIDRADEILGILHSRFHEPKTLEDHPKVQLQKRRKNCLEEICKRGGNIDDDTLLDIRYLLDNVRF